MNRPIILTVSAKAQHGKDSFAEAFKKVAEENKNRILIIHYADILKYVCKEYFGWNGEKDETGRSLLQRIGTEVVRNNYPDAWASCVVALIKGLQSEYDFVIIPDTRFPNEIECWEDTDFFMFSIRLNRKNEDGSDYQNNLLPEQKNHPSETSLDDYGFNYIIENKNLDDIEFAAKAIYEDILKMDVKE